MPGLTQPRGIAVDAEGHLIVVAQTSSRVFVLDLNGRVLRTVTHPDLTSGTGISQSPSGDWYIGNFSPGRVVVFDSSWNHSTTIQASGMNGVNCVSFDANGDFAVSAAFANRVYRFDAQHAPLGTVSHSSIGSPMSIAADSQGNHFLSNGSSGVVTMFDSAWAPTGTFGAGILAAPQGIAVDEHDRLTITNFSSSTVHRFDNRGNLLGSFPATGVAVARNLAFQTSAYVLARAGSVGHAAGFPQTVLTVPGETLDAMGRLSLARGQGFGLDIGASSAGPSPVPFLLFLAAGDPGPAAVEILPHGAGLFAFPTPLGGSLPLASVSGLGPGTVFSLPQGLHTPVTFTLQALLVDNASAAAPAFPVSASNAIVLTIG